MKTFIYFLLFASFLATGLFAFEEHKALESVLKKLDINSTFVLYDMQTEKYVGYNKTRAYKRYSPASTFKIANSLIGLETKAVKSVDEPIPYLGPENPFMSEWKEDMGLRRAITISNVPIYQELARRVGLTKMKRRLKSLGYGNADVGERVDRFWLDGPLEISAIEQIEFLKKLLEEKLPISQQTQKDVKRILLLESGAAYTLYGKTGWQNAPNSGTGWFIGWLENSQGIYIFAFNMDMSGISDAPKRVSLTKECLFALGLLKKL